MLAGFVTGLLFGSFLNVCISRLPQHESVVKPRSRSPECSAAIRWYDNITLVSWVVLRARCRNCKATISWRYPLVELALGFGGAFLGSKFWHAWFVMGFVTVREPKGLAISASLQILSLAILGFLLIGLMVMDWQTMKLPDAFTLWGIFIAMMLVCVHTVL